MTQSLVKFYHTLLKNATIILKKLKKFYTKITKEVDFGFKVLYNIDEFKLRGEF